MDCFNQHWDENRVFCGSAEVSPLSVTFARLHKCCQTRVSWAKSVLTIQTYLIHSESRIVKRGISKPLYS